MTSKRRFKVRPNVLKKLMMVRVVGAGTPQGCEAALQSARLGRETHYILLSVLMSIAMMPCNPNIGGSSKGTSCKGDRTLSVGEMGKKYRMQTFNSVKNGLMPQTARPVHSLRAQGR